MTTTAPHSTASPATVGHVTDYAKTLPVVIKQFCADTVPGVNAAQLHANLMVGTEFRKWITRHVEEGAYVEGRDYTFDRKQTAEVRRGRPIKFNPRTTILKVGVAMQIAAHMANAHSTEIRHYLTEQSSQSKAAAKFTKLKADQTIPMPKPTLAHVAPVQHFEPVEVTEGVIGGIKCLVVDARALWDKLGVSRDFSNWVKGRILKFGFAENVDYLLAKSGEQLPSGKKYSHDYSLSLNMAKELAMVENNDKGRQARRYFIECERKLFESSLTNSAVQARSVEMTEMEMYDRNWMPDSDMEVLTSLVKAKYDRLWLLTMQSYGKVLLLSRKEQLSEEVACAYQARIASQLQEKISGFGEEVFTETGLQVALVQIGQWTPNDV